MTEGRDADADRRGPDTLGQLAWTWRDVQQARIAAQQRGGIIAEQIAPELAKTEARLAKLTVRELKRHQLWPFLSGLPGLRGIHVARLVALIRDPRRFPGQKCTEGHTLPAIYPVSSPCPLGSGEEEKEECRGLMMTPRSGTGVRSLWHYLGLHVVNGRSPSKRRGSKADWNPQGRTMVLMPDGIADQIIRQRTEPYRGIYEAAKLRLQARAVASTEFESLSGSVPANPEPDAVEVLDESEGAAGGIGPLHEPEAVANSDASDGRGGGLRPFQIDAIARKIAVKAFVADLLREWQRLLAESRDETDAETGGEPPDSLEDTA